MSAIKGGKKKRRGKNFNCFVKPFVEPSKDQFFAKAIKPLGSLKVLLEVYFYNINNKGTKEESISFIKEELIGIVRGSMRKREYVNPGNIVLISQREFSKDGKIVDIVMKYPSNHYNLIMKHKLCPSDIVFQETTENDEVNFGFENNENQSDDEQEMMNNSGFTPGLAAATRQGRDQTPEPDAPQPVSEAELTRLNLEQQPSPIQRDMLCELGTQFGLPDITGLIDPALVIQHKTMKKRRPVDKNENYMANIIPDFDDEFEDAPATETLSREVDAFGNFI